MYPPPAWLATDCLGSVQLIAVWGVSPTDTQRSPLTLLVLDRPQAQSSSDSTACRLFKTSPRDYTVERCDCREVRPS